MASAETYIRMRAFARVDGAKLGLFWIVSFALFIGSFKYPVCGMLWMSTMVATPFLVAILTKLYSDKTPGKRISYRHAYAHSALTVFYASLIMAIAQWAYFQYLDHGQLMSRYASILSDPQFSKSLESMGYSKNILTKMIEQLRAMRPIDIALQLLWSNMIAGLLMSLTTALYVSSRRYFKPNK